MKLLGKCFGQPDEENRFGKSSSALNIGIQFLAHAPVSNGLDHDDAVVVHLVLILLAQLLAAEAGRHGETTDVVLHSGALGGDEVGDAGETSVQLLLCLGR